MDKKQNTVIAGMIGTFILAIAKTGLSIISGSAALIADALHSFSDLLVSLLVLLGMKFNRKKIEATITFTIGILIISVAVGFVRELFFREQPAINNIAWTIPGQIIIIIVTYVLYRYKTVIGKEENSESLVADGAHTKSDMFSSIGVLASLMGSMIGLNIDKAVAFVIFFLVLYQGLETILSAIYLYRDKEKFHLNLQALFHEIVVYAEKKKKIFLIFSIIILLLAYAVPGFYIIRQHESGVRTVLGVVDSQILKPGLHFDPIHPLSSINTFATTEIHSMTYGYSENPDGADDILINQLETIHNSGKYLVNSNEEELITGDGSITRVYLILEYQLSDPYKYYTASEAPLEILRFETGSMLQKITGSLSLFEVLNNKRSFIESELCRKLNISMNQLGTGLSIENIIIYSLSPHPETLYMFRMVQDEEQLKKTLLYEAEAMKSKQIPYYRGLAYEKVVNAVATANEIVFKAERDAASYKMLEKEYELNREAVMYRLSLDSRVRLLKNSQKILIEGSLKEDQIRLNYKSRAQ